MLKEFFAIWAYPTLGTERRFQQKLVLLLQIYGIIFLFNLLTAPIAFAVDFFATHVLHFKSITKQYHISMLRFFEKFGYFKAVLYICIAAPVIEESIFRLPLSFKRQHIALSLGFALVLAAKILPGLQQQSLAVNLVARAILFVVGYLIFNRVLPRIQSPGEKLQSRLIIISILCFGLMHIFNYVPLQWNIIYLYPFFVIPQLFMGWLLTYIRFKNGFFWGIALHALINSVSMLIYTAFRH
ncbi:type II CAAX prenyl endopeptidase Rce1 family protein [Mucilaginibacter sp. AK015]|uniref:CPBP family glutamic-type intramembrane protease n=1 Tax=Mucilaginibacter sp. AK015 TaxID=2723072 RepID=UPI0016192CF8|nr:CPBP family glutamic-type intramembrane protease [Mucilaginibacter sp. AK015]MBB5394930.1 hypothetical protein [Mucilaginibacter sp. AK015]